jgi:hypothetical protein
VQIYYKIIGSPGWSNLFDDTKSNAMPEFAPSFKYVNIISQGFGAASQSVTPAANRILSVPLPKYLKLYATPDAALDAVRVMDSTFAGIKVHLQIIMGATNQYYVNCSLDSMVTNVQGASVEFTMTFQAESITNVAPTT